MPTGNLITSDLHAREGSASDLARARDVLDQVMDPEVPVVSVTDLGIVREIDWRDGHLFVAITPTYSGCPATEFIESSVRDALVEAGFATPKIEQRIDPAWTTDWITEQGRQRLKAYGIAPPVGSASKPRLPGETFTVECPNCGSSATEEITEFGSTACKALYRCTDCLEPFDYFKCI